MKIAAGIITWQDGDALDNCVESIRGVVDEIVIADGLIDGIDAGGLDPLTSRIGLAEAAPDAIVRQGRWPTQSAQRNWTLDVARGLECDWLLTIDADEELRNASALRPWLEVWDYDAFPLPFYFTDVVNAQPCPFKCLRVAGWKRYICQGSILENRAGEIVQLTGQGAWSDPAAEGLPYLVHRPELRPLGRREIRLSEHELALEPYPDGVIPWAGPVQHTPPALLVDALAAAAGSSRPVWYCPGCGRRYAGPGSCMAEHERISLVRLDVAAGVAA